LRAALGLGCDRIDKRLAKALRKLEQSVGPPVNEKMRRDAFNAANSAYKDLHAASGDVIRAVACTLVCACWDYPNSNLLGNFRAALIGGEHLSWVEVSEIESEVFRRCLRGYE
jgi:hypothetical protein